MVKLTLRKGEEKRIRAGHLWVYSNEIDTVRTPLKSIEPGSACLVEDAQGKALGVGYVNPHSLIAIRLMTRNSKASLSKSLLKKRLQSAMQLREQLYPTSCYRWVYGESDGLPGLIIDRFGDYIVMQINTAGMERLREPLIELIDSLVRPRAILNKSESTARVQEGLESVVEVEVGQWPDEDLMVEENGVEFLTPALDGQKTGWFYDHRDNRNQLSRLVTGKRVLDMFSYVGGWGIQAAVAGASEVTCVDASALAIDYVMLNAQHNSVTETVVGIEGKAFDVMEALLQDGEKYDVVVMDPPAFIKRKKDHKNGLNAYRHANELAVRLLNKGGVLVSGSCSMHLAGQELVNLLRQTGRHIDRHIQLFYQGTQAMDHPVHPAIPETQYLKALFSRVESAL